MKINIFVKANEWAGEILGITRKKKKRLSKVYGFCGSENNSLFSKEADGTGHSSQKRNMLELGSQ